MGRHWSSLGRGREFSGGRSLVPTHNHLGNLKSSTVKGPRCQWWWPKRPTETKLRLLEYEGRTWPDPATQHSPAGLEVRCGNPLGWHLAQNNLPLNRVCLKKNWSRDFGRVWGFCHQGLALQTFPRENICCWAQLDLSQTKDLDDPLAPQVNKRIRGFPGVGSHGAKISRWILLPVSQGFPETFEKCANNSSCNQKNCQIEGRGKRDLPPTNQAI